LPAVTPVIPAWQLQPNSAGKSDDESDRTESRAESENVIPAAETCGNRTDTNSATIDGLVEAHNGIKNDLANTELEVRMLLILQYYSVSGELCIVPIVPWLEVPC